MLDEKCEQGGNKHDYFLSSQDRARRFAVKTDRYNDMTLLKGNEPLAWFSRMMSEKTVDAFIELIKGYELAMKNARANQFRDEKNTQVSEI